MVGKAAGTDNQDSLRQNGMRFRVLPKSFFFRYVLFLADVEMKTYGNCKKKKKKKTQKTKKNKKQKKRIIRIKRIKRNTKIFSRNIHTNNYLF